jgi:hypothetical protein
VSFLDETHQRISEFADEFLDDDEREAFVDSLMERRGYKRSAHWEPPDPDGGGSGRQPLVKNKGGSAGGGRPSGQSSAPRSYFGGAGKR